MNPWQEAEVRARQAIGQAERALAIGDRIALTRVVQELQAALEIRSDQPEWALVLGRVYEALGDWNGVAGALSPLFAGDPVDFELGVRLATAYRVAGRPRDALRVLDVVLRHSPSFEFAYCLKTQLHAELGEHEQADESYFLARTWTDACPRCDLAIAQSLVTRTQTPDTPEPLAPTGVSARARNNSRPAARAVPLLMRLLRVPETAGQAHEIHLLLAQAHRLSGKPQQVRDSLFSAIQTARASVPPQKLALLHYDLGLVLLYLGDADAAIAQLRKAVEYSPDYADARATLAHQLFRRRQYLPALSAAIKAMELKPGLPGINLLIARCYVQTGHVSFARRALAREAALAERTIADVLAGSGGGGAHVLAAIAKAARRPGASTNVGTTPGVAFGGVASTGALAGGGGGAAGGGGGDGGGAGGGGGAMGGVSALPQAAPFTLPYIPLFPRLSSASRPARPPSDGTGEESVTGESDPERISNGLPEEDGTSAPAGLIDADAFVSPLASQVPSPFTFSSSLFVTPQAAPVATVAAVAAPAVACVPAGVRVELLESLATPEVLLEAAMLADRLRRPRLAVRLLRQLALLAPESPSAWQNLAVLLLRRRRLAEGLSASFRALQLAPHDPAILHNLALAHARCNDFVAATHYVQLARRYHPDDAALAHLHLRLRIARLLAPLKGLRKQLRKRLGR